MVRTKLRKRVFVLASSGIIAGSVSTVGLVVASSGPAIADTSPFLAYCPATNIGDIALGGTVVSGTLSPNPVDSGATATVTPAVNVTLPAGLVNAAIALGSTSISGYLSGQIDVTGATPSSVAIGGPSTAPATVYSGVGEFPANTLTLDTPLTLSIPLSPVNVTAGASGTVHVYVHPTLTVFDLVSPGPPATYLPLSCSGVNTTAVGTGAVTSGLTGSSTDTSIVLGNEGPIQVAGGVSQAIPSGTAIMVTDGTTAVLATTSGAVSSGGTSIPVVTGAGGPWTAKANVPAANQVLVLTPAQQLIDSDPITPVPFLNAASPNSVSFLTGTDSHVINVSGGNWGANQTSATCTIAWSSGTDTGTCTTDGSGNLTGTITASVTGEQGANVTPFQDTVRVTANNAVSTPTLKTTTVTINPFVSLDSFCSPTAGQLVPTNPGGLSTPPGSSPENPLTITRGAGADGYTGTGLPAPGNAYSNTLPTPTVGCDPRQQINAFVLGSSLYIWESQTGANPDASHVNLSPVKLGLDTTFSALGGDQTPCAPPFAGPTACTPGGAVNNGQFDQALGQLNQVTVQDDRGTLTGWTVTGQMESPFNNLDQHGPAADNVIPADFMTWSPSVTLSTPGTLPANNANPAPGSPCESGAAIQAILPGCVVGPSGLPQPVGGGAGVNGYNAGTGGSSSQPAEVNAGLPLPLNDLTGSADVLCATDLSLAGGAAGGGGSFDCNAGLLLAIPPYVASGQYQATIDLIVLGF